MRSERRRAKRHQAETVVYLLYGKQMAIPTLMIDLNDEGLSIQAAQPLPAVDEVPVHFLLPGTRNAVDANAELVWADDCGRAGMFFSRLNGASKRHLKNWLARVASKSMARGLLTRFPPPPHGSKSLSAPIGCFPSSARLTFPILRKNEWVMSVGRRL